MLNEVRGSVTWWKAQNDIFLKKTTKVIFPIGYPTTFAYKTSMTKLIIYTPQTMCQCARENQIENVISHAANESNTI